LNFFFELIIFYCYIDNDNAFFALFLSVLILLKKVINMMKKSLFVLFSAIVLLVSPMKAWVGEYELDHEVRVTRTPKGIRAQMDGVDYNLGTGLHLKKGAYFQGQRLLKDLNLDVNMTPLQFRRELSKFGEVTSVRMSISEFSAADTKKAPAAAKKKPAVAKKKPAVAKKKPAAAKKKPVAVKKKPVAAKKRAAVAKKRAAVAKKKPAVAKKKPAVTKKKPVAAKRKRSRR